MRTLVTEKILIDLYIRHSYYDQRHCLKSDPVEESLLQEFLVVFNPVRKVQDYLTVQIEIHKDTNSLEQLVSSGKSRRTLLDSEILQYVNTSLKEIESLCLAILARRHLKRTEHFSKWLQAPLDSPFLEAPKVDYAKESSWTPGLFSKNYFSNMLPNSSLTGYLTTA